jgi:hypothetical protein
MTNGKSKRMHVILGLIVVTSEEFAGKVESLSR